MKRNTAGTSGEPFAANVTSGLAIAEIKKDQIAVYFGCIVSPLRGEQSLCSDCAVLFHLEASFSMQK